MTLKECMKKKKPYMVHEEAIGGVDGCPSSQPFLHCEKGLCEQDDKGRGSTWTSLCTYCWNQPMEHVDMNVVGINFDEYEEEMTGGKRVALVVNPYMEIRLLTIQLQQIF